MKARFFLKFAVAALLALSQLVLAQSQFKPVNDDTDLFLNNPNIPGERPNVLIVLDNTANWNLAFTNEKSALVQVVNGLSDQYNVGLMMMVETGAPNDNVFGGYVRFHVRQMIDTNKTVLSTMVNNLIQSGSPSDVGNKATTGLAMYEAYLYYAGLASRSGFGKVKTDFTGNTTANNPATSLSGHALPANPTSASLYNSPVSDSCQKNFIIYISNGPANENAADRAELQARLAALTGKSPPDTIAISPSLQQGNWADEMAKFMANADVNTALAGIQNVVTYTVEVNPNTTGQGPDMTALLRSMASNGKGKYFGVTSDASGTAIVDALNQIFTEVQAVNSVFASTTLPVSVNVRGTNLNQVYIGVFRPDPHASPRWFGNLKLYNLALNTATGQVFLADGSNGIPPAVGLAAENPITGFITSSATSFWTQSSNFWAFRDPSQNGVGGPSDKVDGDLVEKGGAAEQVRIAYAAAEGSSPKRRLYTCTTGSFANCNPGSPGSLLSATPFSTANTDIDAVSLQLNVRLVSPLTGFQSQPVTSLTDRRPATLTNAAAPISVTSLTNGATTRTVTSLTTATPKTLTSLTGVAANTQTVAISSITKSGNITTVHAAAALPSQFQNGATVTITGGTGVTGNFTISALNTTANTFEINATGNTAGTGGSAAVTVSINSTTATATLSPCVDPITGLLINCFSSGQQVTIAGASPSQFNGVFGITVIDSSHFTYTMTTAAGAATGTITASGNTTTATAIAAGHGLNTGDSVVIFGASPAGYNGTFTVTKVNTDTFTYTVNPALAPNTASPVYMVKGGSTTVSVKLTNDAPFVNLNPVTIAGSDIAGYNGTFTVTWIDAKNFSYSTSSVLPANTSATVTASPGTQPIVTATVTNHGYTVFQFVVIESTSTPADPNHPGTYTIQTVPNANTFTYSTGGVVGLPAPTGGFTARLLSNIAYVTVPNHGYATGNQVKIAGASPTAYNGTFTITVVDANTFTYPLTTAPGPNTSTAVTASVQSTNAQAHSVGHQFSDGDTVTISGATPAQFNGSFRITVINNDPDNFSYTISSAAGDATGSIVAVSSSGIDRTKLINWVRGEDNAEDENTNTNNSDVRASVHGDVLHSRPAVVNYNRFGSDNDVYVFYGANDGIFHAIKGGYASDAGDSAGLAPGAEAWGFIPKEFFGSFTRLRNNSPSISASFKKPYFADGPIGVYTSDANNNGRLGDSGDSVNLYIATHRGGRFIYALDVNSPTNPKFLWKIDNTTAGFRELGETWSQPTVVKDINGYSNPVLIFGAGYDPAVEDIDPSTVTAASSTFVTTAAGTTNRAMGRGIYVVDALTGALVWSAGHSGGGFTVTVSGMDFAIPSDVTVVKNFSGNATNRAYVGDMGGNVWRIDFSGTNLRDTTVTHLAAVGDLSTAGGRRKFMFPPDVVAQAGGFDAVLIGSGDREHPFDTSVLNKFYMFKDFGTDLGPVTGNATAVPALSPVGTNPTIFSSDLFDATNDCIQDVSACTGGQTPASALSTLQSKSGWFINLLSGEKVVGPAISAAGTTFFNTNQPSATANAGTCGSNLGIARQYQVGTVDATATSNLNYATNLSAASRSQIAAGGGYLPAPVLVVVQLGGRTVEAVISGVQVSTPTAAALSARLRKYWYKEVD